jgi:hypothetical protein
MNQITISFTLDVDPNEVHPDTVAAMIYSLLLDTPGVANPQRKLETPEAASR